MYTLQVRLGWHAGACRRGSDAAGSLWAHAWPGPHPVARGSRRSSPVTTCQTDGRVWGARAVSALRHRRRRQSAACCLWCAPPAPDPHLHPLQQPTPAPPLPALRRSCRRRCRPTASPRSRRTPPASAPTTSSAGSAPPPSGASTCCRRVSAGPAGARRGGTARRTSALAAAGAVGRLLPVASQSAATFNSCRLSHLMCTPYVQSKRRMCTERVWHGRGAAPGVVMLRDCGPRLPPRAPHPRARKQSTPSTGCSSLLPHPQPCARAATVNTLPCIFPWTSEPPRPVTLDVPFAPTLLSALSPPLLCPCSRHNPCCFPPVRALRPAPRRPRAPSTPSVRPYTSASPTARLLT